MGSHSGDRRSGWPPAAVLLKGEVQVRQLRLSVSAPTTVLALTLEVVEGDAAHSVSPAADSNDTRVAAPLHEIDKETREGEVAQVVGSELELEAIRRLPSWRSHYARVVDKQIDPIVFILEPLGK